jgi:steroid delta-isomerase-like uncharacterized protein
MLTKPLLQAKKGLEELDIDQILDVYAEDAVFEDISDSQRITDRAQLRNYYEQLFSLPGVAFSDICIFDGQIFAAIEWTWSGRKRQTGKEYHVRGASVIELRDGKIIRESIYYDPRSAV